MNEPRDDEPRDGEGSLELDDESSPRLDDESSPRLDDDGSPRLDDDGSPRLDDPTGGDLGDAPPSRRRRRRPHAVRRWLVRPVLWLLVALVALVGVAALVVDSSWFEEKVRLRLVEEASEALGREVTIEAVDLDLLPPALAVSGVVVPGPEPDDRPVLTAAAARVEAEVESWRPLSLRLAGLRIEQPDLYLELGPDGQTNLPQIVREEPSGESRFEIELRRLTVESGLVTVNELQLPLAVDARGLRATFTGSIGGGGLDLAGRLLLDEVLLELPGARPYTVSLAADVAIDPQRLTLSDARLEGAELSADLRGEVGWQSGGVDGGEGNRVHLGFEAEGDAALVGLLGYSDQVSGPFRFDGELDWSPQRQAGGEGSRGGGGGWRLTGDLTSERLVASGRTVRDLEAAVVGDPDAVTVAIARARYAEGSLSGPVRVLLGGERPAVSVDLDLERLALSRLLADAGAPVTGLAGWLSGSASYRFTVDRPEAGDGWADLHLDARQLAGRAITFRGELPLTLSDGVVESAAARFIAMPEGVPRQRLLVEELRIDLPRGDGRLRYRLESEDISRLRVLLPPEAVYEQAAPPPWLPTAGAGTVSGTVRFQPLTVTAELDLTDVASPGATADRLTGALRVVSAGAGQPAGTLAIEGLRLEAERGDGAVLVTGRVPLGEGAGALAVEVDAVRWPAEESLAWLPEAVTSALPLTGPMSGSVSLEDAGYGVAGSAQLTLEPALVAGFAADSLAVELSFDPQQLAIERARLAVPAGSVEARGTIGLGEEGGLDFVVDSTRLDLAAAPICDLLPGVTGGAVLTATVGGTAAAPQVELELRADEVRMAGRQLGRMEIDATWDGEQLTAGGSVLGLVFLDGGGRLALLEDATGEGVDLSFTVSSEEVAALTALALGEPVPGLAGGFRGTLSVSGALDAPEVLLELPEVTVSYQGRRFAALTPAKFRLAGDRLEIRPLYLGSARPPALPPVLRPATAAAADDGGGQDTARDEIFLIGEVPLGEGEIDLRFQAEADTRWLEPFLPSLRLSGKLNALGGVRGPLDAPYLDGQAELTQGQVIAEGFPHALDQLSLVVLAYQDRLVLSDVDGRLGGGKIKAEGSYRLADDSSADPYRLQLQAQDVLLRYPEGWVIEGDAELSLVPLAVGRSLRGRVELDRALYVEDVQTNMFRLLRGLLRQQRLEVASADPALASTQLNVLLQVPRGLRISNNVADLRGSADLVVRGSLARPVVVGEVQLDPGGKLTYNDIEYSLEQGQLTFASPTRTEPIIDLTATSRVNSYDVTLSLSGTLDRLNANFTSDPPLPSLSVLTLVATGAPAQSDLLDGTGVTGSGSADSSVVQGILVNQAASALSSRAASLFGLDRLAIAPSTSSDASAGATAVTLGKQISRELYVRYTRDPAATEENVVEAEWTVNPGLVLIFTSRDGVEYAVDVRWEKRY